MKSKICPSLLSCNFAELGKEALRMISFNADYLHVDVMDGHFVPNITLGAPIVKCLRKAIPSSAFLDCHLMVDKPQKWIKDFALSGANGLTFHYEVSSKTVELEDICKEIRKNGMKVGIALKPGTQIEEPLLVLLNNNLVDMVLIMTVEPGFGGQKFMESCLPKVEFIRRNYPSLDIQVDGGLDLSNIEAAAKAGANVIVAGTSIFGAEDPEKVIGLMRIAVDKEISNKSIE
jgi:ribulose-phosphate 3-epimerase